MSGVKPIVSHFTPPGGLRDFDESQRGQWHQLISDIFDQTVKGYTQWPSDGTPQYTIKNNAPRSQFFNPAKTGRSSDYTEKTVSWVGFPKRVDIESPTERARWKKADQSRHVQDEYCEWSVTRDSDGTKIKSVSFTCEGPEYWRFLGDTNPDKIVDLYRAHIDPAVKREHLFDRHGNYIPQNQWNRDTANGAMHLIQKNNTLFAEIELAGGASMVREVDGRVLDAQQELIECGMYGEPMRHSDPKIGEEVNALARLGAMVSLRDPVGLYFDEFAPVGWITPDGSDPRSYWRIVRGDVDTPVRAVYEVPRDKGFTVSDIKINGTPIEYGSQIADSVRIKLVGIAQNFGKVPVTRFGCVTYDPVRSDLFSTMSLATRSQPAWRYFPS